MDNLMKSAKAFEKLINTEYIMTISKKGKTTTLKIIFSADDFKHLAGLHKLKDLNISSNNSGSIFKKCLRGEITEVNLRKSQYFEGIRDRIENLKNLEQYIDCKPIPFKWDNKRCLFKCEIIADYLLKENTKAIDTVYIFLKEKKSLFKSNKMTIDYIKNVNAISLFKDTKDYTQLQERYTLIRLEKLDLKTQNKALLFDFETEKLKEKVKQNEKRSGIEKMLIDAGYTPTDKLIKDIIMFNDNIKEIKSIKELKEIYSMMNKVVDDFIHQEHLEAAAHRMASKNIDLEL